MSPNAAVDIHTLIAAGRVIEAGTLLAMHGEELPPDMRQELEQERQRLWQRANELVTEAEALEQAGWTEEAWTTYHKAAKIANDLPGLQETLKRMDEAMALTKAVQHRSKRIRQNAARVAGKAQQSRRRTPLLAAVVLLGIGAGLWLVKTPPKTALPPVQPPPTAAPATSEIAAPQPPTATVSGPTAAPLAPQSLPSQPTPASAPAPAPQPPSAVTADTTVTVPSNPQPPPPTTAPAMPPSAAPSLAPTALTYTVQAGDTLSLIAERQLCSAEAWSKIFKKNRKLVSHTNKLTIGTQLDLSGLPNRCPQQQ